MNELFWLTLLLFAIAAALRSELFFYLLYVLVGLQVLARVWLRRDIKQLSWRRRAPIAAFPGEHATVEIELTNGGLRSEERRVGKEWRSRWGAVHQKAVRKV